MIDCLRDRSIPRCEFGIPGDRDTGYMNALFHPLFFNAYYKGTSTAPAGYTLDYKPPLRVGAKSIDDVFENQKLLLNAASTPATTTTGGDDDEDAKTYDEGVPDPKASPAKDTTGPPKEDDKSGSAASELSSTSGDRLSNMLKLWGELKNIFYSKTYNAATYTPSKVKEQLGVLIDSYNEIFKDDKARKDFYNTKMKPLIQPKSKLADALKGARVFINYYIRDGVDKIFDSSNATLSSAGVIVVVDNISGNDKLDDKLKNQLIQNVVLAVAFYFVHVIKFYTINNVTDDAVLTPYRQIADHFVNFPVNGSKADALKV